METSVLIMHKTFISIQAKQPNLKFWNCLSACSMDVLHLFFYFLFMIKRSKRSSMEVMRQWDHERGKKTCKLCVRVSCYCQHEAVLDTVTQSPFPLHSVLFLVARNWSLGSVSPRPSCHQASGGDLDSANRTWNEIWKAEESTCSFSRSGSNWQWQPCILLAIRPCLWDRGGAFT